MNQVQEPKVFGSEQANFTLLCQAIIEKNSKSFAFASRFLPKSARADASVLYAWCRYVDDAIDEVPNSEMPQALSQLYLELEHIYSADHRFEGSESTLKQHIILTNAIDEKSMVLKAFKQLVQKHQIPKQYPLALLDGMRMDVEAKQYVELSDLYLYCYRVASVVGLMMCYILQVKESEALLKAAYLGLAMQLTNICRDVSEDWGRGRLYLPLSLLCSGSSAPLMINTSLPKLTKQQPKSTKQKRFEQSEIPSLLVEPIQIVTSDLLKLADSFYQKGFSGLKYLPWQSSLAIHAAGLIYQDIGRVLISQSCHPNRPRAITSKGRKLLLSLKSLLYGASFACVTRMSHLLTHRNKEHTLKHLSFNHLWQDIQQDSIQYKSLVAKRNLQRQDLTPVTDRKQVGQSRVTQMPINQMSVNQIPSVAVGQFIKHEDKS